ncbi:unnamed protein product [Cercopithifilaria johnstoni]|uniref:G-protein coupled receptors family 1 profile domain-containing protein n=1 Tax=Cercopithifilaria johnstoni TaxID=2874296 RepID=A0A8J2MJC5_9BILA|nr:unnamed protein product [Cercopithifilaria johnstoni]
MQFFDAESHSCKDSSRRAGSDLSLKLTSLEPLTQLSQTNDDLHQTDHQDQCSFLEDSIRCSVLNISKIAPLECFRYAFTAITIERFIAMCFYHRYQEWKYPIALAFIPLTWVQLALGIKNAAALVLHQGQKTNKSFCSSVTISPAKYINLILEIPLLICIFFLLLITRIISKRKMILQMRVSMDSLSSRYQIRENMKTSKTVFIATIMFIITSLLNLSGVFLLIHFLSADLLYFAILKEIVSLSFAIFINAIPLLLIVRVGRMHDQIIEWLLPFGCGRSNRVGHELSGQRQMDIMKQMWEKEIRR